METAIKEIKEIKTIVDAVVHVFDSYAVGYKFYGHQLHRDVTRIYPAAENAYTDTLLRALRRYRRSSFIAVNQKSLYEKVG
ncbi:MAG: hypothetical protein FWD87_08000 [Spirochaetaceae bacterium]|nr:hypothetical protein [Spirochaetaceae bacterium]